MLLVEFGSKQTDSIAICSSHSPDAIFSPVVTRAAEAEAVLRAYLEIIPSRVSQGVIWCAECERDVDLRYITCFLMQHVFHVYPAGSFCTECFRGSNAVVEPGHA